MSETQATKNMDDRYAFDTLKHSYLAFVMQNATDEIMNMRIIEFKAFLRPRFIEFAKKKGYKDEQINKFNTFF